MLICLILSEVSLISSRCCCLSLVWIKTEVVLAFLGPGPGKRKKKKKEKEKRRKTKQNKTKRWGEIKEGRSAGKEKSPFSTSHSCVFSQPGKHINPSAFTLGNKGTQPDCGGKGDKKDPGTLKRERARSRNSWDFTFRGALCCRHRGLAHTDTRARAETTDKWRCKDSQGQLLSPHPTCQEGEKTARGKKKAARPSGQDRLRVRGSLGAGAAAHPPLYCSAVRRRKRLGRKSISSRKLSWDHTSDCLLNPLHSISMSHSVSV